MLDLIGQRFGRLTVVGKIMKQRKKCRETYWICECDCGGSTETLSVYLKKGQTTHCQACKRDKTSLIGKRFGTLTIVSFDDVINNLSYWNATCDCGDTECLRELSVSISSLLSPSAKNRKCRNGRKGNKSGRWKGVGEIPGDRWNQIINGAESRGFEVKIEFNDIWDKFIEQDRKCALTGDELTFGQRGIVEVTASLDRIDSNVGYTKENIQWVHKHINKMKLDLSVDELLYWCNLVINKDNTEYKLEIPDIKRSKVWTGYGLISGGMLYRMGLDAKSRDIEVAVTIEELWDKYVKQNGRCGITNIPLIIPPRTTAKKSDITASVDRIYSNGIYEISNIRWVHKKINHMKWEWTDEYFNILCQKIINYHKTKERFEQ